MESVLVIVGWENMAREISDSGFMRASSRGERRISILTFLRSCAWKGGARRGSISCDDDGISIKVDMFLFKSIRGWVYDKITRNTDRYRVNIKLSRLIYAITRLAISWIVICAWSKPFDKLTWILCNFRRTNIYWRIWTILYYIYKKIIK